MWIIVLVLFAVVSGVITFALDPIGSIVALLKLGAFGLAAITGAALLLGAPFATFGGICIAASIAWILLSFISTPRPAY